MHAWAAWHVRTRVAQPTSLPTNVLFVHYSRSVARMGPATSPSEASPLLCCATVQRTWTQADDAEDLGLLGRGLDRRKMQADVGIILAPALQVTEIARSYVLYMTSSYLS